MLSSAWILRPSYTCGKDIPTISLSETLFRHLNRPEVQGITSVITLIEVCVHPQRLGRRDLLQAYERALVHSRQVRMVPIDAP